MFSGLSNSEERAAVSLLMFTKGCTHVLFGWARRKLSEYWLNPINNAGIHVSTISCFWYFPNPPRNGRTLGSMRVSSSGDVVSGDTKPFSGWWSSVSSCTTAIAVSPIDASCLCSRGCSATPCRLHNASVPQLRWWKPCAVNHWNGNEAHLFIIRKHFPPSATRQPCGAECGLWHRNKTQIAVND